MAASSLGVNSSHEAYYYQAADSLVADSAVQLNFQELLGGAVRQSSYSPLPPRSFSGAVGSEMSSFPISSYYCSGAGAYYDAARTTNGRAAPPGRIGFRTRSEVEVLDDGFRWRKYGKKAVKSSPNLRNYYRCSAEGCGVKKRVERDRDDPRYVLTSYDGVHNHATPGSHHGVSQPEAAYSSPPAAPAAWTWSDLHAAAAAHSSESSY